MQIRICAENIGGNVEGLPSPSVDLVFDNLGVGQVKMYIVEPDGTVSKYGPHPAHLRMSIADLQAVVAALDYFS